MTQNLFVCGGIGNQMFLYAMYLVMKRMGKKVRLDISQCNHLRTHNGYELEKAFGIEAETVDNESIPHRFLLRFMVEYWSFGLLYQDTCELDQPVLETRRPYIRGFFQSDAYFQSCREEVISSFKFRNISDENGLFAKEMSEINSVSLHIRRGDYLTNDRYTGICNEEYYRRAVGYIIDKVPTPHFYIFSDDLPWASQFAASLGIDYRIVDFNRNENSWQDMYLMSQCRHNILANSSFSWWGAYLNRHEDAIRIAPATWDNYDSPQYNAIRVPQSYIRL